MFTNWNKRGRLHAEEKTSLAFERLVSLGQAKRGRRTEVWKKANSQH